MRVSAAFLAGTLAFTLALGCGVKRKKTGSSAQAAEKQEQPDEGSSSPLGNLDAIGSMLAKNMDQPGPYDPPRESPDFDGDADHIGILSLSGSIVEMQSFSWFSTPGGQELRQLTDKLDKLAKKSQVKGLLLRVSDLSLSAAAAEELRAALLRFKKPGERKLGCHAERLSNITYYIMSVCDSISLAPVGGLEISGAAAMPLHLKGMLDKIGIRADFVTIGAYKGAAEPITRDAPSDEMRETLQAIIDRMYDTMVAGIAEGRKLEPAAVQALIDKAMFLPEEAQAAKLIDSVAIYENYRKEFVGELGWHNVKMGKGGGAPDMAKLMEFLGVMPRARPSQPHVALVYALGNIIEGTGGGVIGARQEIAGRTLAAALRAVGANDSVKAVVLRVDSGGGSALASEQILTALDEIKAKKPVIVSMGGVAASGGYYISCHANKVFALDNTITGSIGVLGGKLAMKEMFDEVGIKTYPMGRGKRALMNSMVEVWTEEERTLVKENMEAVYKTFVNHVAQGRNKSYDDVHTIAQGRVWTGHAAKGHGLVDQIGGLQEALAEARTMGGVEADVELEIYPPEPTVMDIIGSFGEVQAGGVHSIGLQGRATALLDQIADTLGLHEARVVANQLRLLAIMRDSPVMTALFLPISFQ